MESRNKAMALEIKYDFKAPDVEDNSEDVRANLRITRCCGNCKFFVAKGNRGFRGYCTYPEPASKQIVTIKDGSRDISTMENSFPRAHMTMLCDLYQIKSLKSLTKLSEWTGKTFLNDGTVSTDEE